MASLDQLAIEQAYQRGWFFGPVWHKFGIQHADLATLTTEDEPVIAAFRQGSMEMQEPEYTAAVENIYERAPHFDGILGPAMQQMLRVDRCGLPDFEIPKNAKFAFDDPAQQEAWECLQRHAGMPATGSGSWAGCHGVGDYHSGIVDLDLAGMPSWMSTQMPNGKTALHACLSAVQRAKAAFGLLWLFRYDGKDFITGKQLDGHSNTGLTFVRSSDGWIGLAIVGRGETCSSQPIWLRLLSTYLDNSNLSVERRINQWWKLFCHELGHNEGSGHRSGDPIMHPSINPNATDNVIDPNSSYGHFLAQQFGGEAVPFDNPTPDPTPPTPPTGDPFAGTKVHFETENGTFWGPYRLSFEPRIPPG